MRCALVTGAAGFVGSAIVRELGASGVEVRTTDRVPKTGTNLASYRAADLRQEDSIGPLVEGADAVIHAAGLAHVFRPDESTARLMHEANGIAAGNVARAAARSGVRRVVLVSSVSVYGSPGAASVDETFPARPSGAYAESKYEGERLALEAVRGTATALTILRPATIYGPGDRGNVARLIGAVARGRFVWIGDGSNYKSLVYVDDFARACVRAALQDTSGDVYNVSAAPETMRSVVEAIARALGRRIPRIGLPAGAARAAAAVAAASPIARRRLRALGASVRKWLSDDAYDGGKFVRRFGEFAAVPMTEGIRREVEWYGARG